MRIPGAAHAIKNVQKWSMNAEWTALRHEVWADHFDSVCDRFDLTEDEIAEMLGDAFGMVVNCMIEDFLTFRFGENGEKNVIDDYLARRGWREKVPARRYLEALRDSLLSLYEVVDIEPGRCMTVRDLIFGGDPVTVEEKLGSETAAQWDRFAGRIVTVNGKTCFTGSLLLFSHEAAEDLLAVITEMVGELRKALREDAKERDEQMSLTDGNLRELALLAGGAALFTDIWLSDAIERATAPLPELRNSDGDEIVFSEARFPIAGDTAAVVAAIEGIEAFERDDPDDLRWTWYAEPPSPEKRLRGNHLTFETNDMSGCTVLGHAEIREEQLLLSANSMQRAERGRELLLARLKELVGRPLTSHQDMQTLLDTPDDNSAAKPELPVEVTEQVLHSFMDRHYREALDKPLPCLAGKTPRQAARTKKGHPQVIDWLKTLENKDARRAAQEGQRPYDFRWMWDELGIDYPR